MQVKKTEIERLQNEALQMKEFLPKVINKTTLQSIGQLNKCQQGKNNLEKVQQRLKHWYDYFQFSWLQRKARQTEI